MEVLKELHSGEGKGTRLFELADDEAFGEERIRKYIAQTGSVGKLCTDSTIVSPEFERSLTRGINSAILDTELGDRIKKSAGINADILYILRGGLSFNPGDALYRLGIRTVKHHIGSQRDEIEPGVWKIAQGDYKKLFEGHGGRREVDLFFGDIVATGTSLRYAMEETAKAMEEKDHKFNSIYFFTIGCQKAEDVFNEMLRIERYKPVFEGCEVNIVYLEGRFGLATEDTPVAVKVPETDLLVYHEGAIPAPGLVSRLLRNPENALERCVVYDGGKRANNWQGHLMEVIGHWHELQDRAFDGLGFYEAVNERFPVFCTENFEDIFPYWKYLGGDEQQGIASRAERKPNKKGHAYLSDLCVKKMNVCERILEGKK